MTLRELITAELKQEFVIESVSIERSEDKGRRGTLVSLKRDGGLTNEWFFSEVNKMSSEEMIAVMRSYLRSDHR